MKALSPQGHPIVATFESVKAEAKINPESFDMSGAFDYTGETEVWWETQKTQRGDDMHAFTSDEHAGEVMFVDSAKNVVPKSKLQYVCEAEIVLRSGRADEIGAMLAGERAAPDVGDVIETRTAQFENGFEADIKLVGGEPTPWIDPVLFDEAGHEIAPGEPSDSILGDYSWRVDGVRYVVTVRAEEPVTA